LPTRTLNPGVVIALLLVCQAAGAQLDKAVKLPQGERLALCLDSGIKGALLEQRGTFAEKIWAYSHVLYSAEQKQMLVYLRTFAGKEEIDLEQASKDLNAFATVLESAHKSCAHVVKESQQRKSTTVIYMVAETAAHSYLPKYKLHQGKVAKY
jgi:hypothetical protein